MSEKHARHACIFCGIADADVGVSRDGPAYDHRNPYRCIELLRSQLEAARASAPVVRYECVPPSWGRVRPVIIAKPDETKRLDYLEKRGYRITPLVRKDCPTPSAA